MKDIFITGDKKLYHKLVTANDIASFENGTVHPVYSTFAIARDAEWCCRLFVVERKEEDEEGIGTFVNVTHKSPALINSEIVFEAEIIELHGNTINCKWIATCKERVIAEGTQGQKILKKAKLDTIFKALTI